MFSALKVRKGQILGSLQQSPQDAQSPLRFFATGSIEVIVLFIFAPQVFLLLIFPRYPLKCTGTDVPPLRIYYSFADPLPFRSSGLLFFRYIFNQPACFYQLLHKCRIGRDRKGLAGCFIYYLTLHGIHFDQLDVCPTLNE